MSDGMTTTRSSRRGQRDEDVRAKVGPAVGCGFVVLGTLGALYSLFAWNPFGVLSGLLTLGLGVTIWYLNSTIRRLEGRIERLERAVIEVSRPVDAGPATPSSSSRQEEPG